LNDYFFFSAPQLKRAPLDGSMHRLPLLALSLAAACVPALSPSAATPSPELWAGCYVLSSPPFPTRIGSSFRLPDSIALETARIGLRFDKRPEYLLRVAYPSNVPRTQAFPLTWTPINDDSILAVVWADGFVGISLRLGRHNGAIRGQAKWTNDVIRVDALDSLYHPSVPTEAVSVACPPSAHQWSRL